MREGLEEAIRARRWFYRFSLPGGGETACALPPEVEPIHDTRLRMLLSLLERTFPEGFGGLAALDLACHQGWFALHLALRGFERVTGIDLRASHVSDARLVAEACGLSNLDFREGDVTRLEPGALGTFDVVLLLGLVYHLEDPIGALRAARAATRTVCVVETQLAPGLGGTIDWGSAAAQKPVVGSFAIVDETEEVESGNPEAGVNRLSLVPSLEGLLAALRAVGFARLEILPPPDRAYEQLASGRRVAVAAFPR